MGLLLSIAWWLFVFFVRWLLPPILVILGVALHPPTLAKALAAAALAAGKSKVRRLLKKGAAEGST
jgi:multisubunit Na+/H+ antiporter MnhG subunit